MNKHSIQILAAILCASLAHSLLAAESNVTVAAYLDTQPKPKFRAGHTLPPLTRSGWELGFDARVALASGWGYGLEYGGYATIESVARDLADPKSDNARVVALAASDPKRFALAVKCSRDLPYQSAPPEAFARNAEGKFVNDKSKSPDGTVWNENTLVWSPAAPESVWREAGRLRAEPLRSLRARAPIGIVFNGGEYGINVPGFVKTPCAHDATVLKDKGERFWDDYISERKGRAEAIIAEAVHAAVPDGQLYIFYTAGGGIRRDPTREGFEWGYNFESMQKASDLPSNESYYKHYNDGWAGQRDMLSSILSAKAHEIELGRPLSYNWLCAGWGGESGESVSDIPHYLGFLKCLYTSGMVGANAGYYALPKGGFDAKFPAGQPPHWLRQMMALGQVHAQFSHLEHFLRDGDLLPGTDPVGATAKTRITYEFPTGGKDVRVLARKLKTKQEWLITAWAAAGDDRDVKVSVPGLGDLTLHARADGSVYHAHTTGGKPVLQSVDQR